MNISQKCNCCIHDEVCSKLKQEREVIQMMTDNEIIKALEDLKKCNNNEIDCGNCILSKFFPLCPEEIGELALDLINRQKEEIERLYKNLETETNHITRLENQIERLLPRLKTAKAEAYKEFAKRLKEMMSYEHFFETDVVVLDKSKLDNLLKEVGEDK